MRKIAEISARIWKNNVWGRTWLIWVADGSNLEDFFQTEVGGKLISTSMLSPPTLTYRYGFSFILMTLTFFLMELSGTLAIFLFIESFNIKNNITLQQVQFWAPLFTSATTTPGSFL